MRDTTGPAGLAPDLAISARGLVKRYGRVVAADGIDLDVARGTIFAVLGPNGAGKTTLIRMLTTLTRPDGGTARVMGHDVVAEPDAVRGAIALTGQFASLDEDLTGRENLVMVALLRGFGWRAAGRRADALFAAFGLSHAAREQVKSYSGGMRRRLDIAASLVVTPGVLFLDEPTTGLDPSARRQVWGQIRDLARSGVTVLLTTQYMEEADQLAERIAVIAEGRKIAEGRSRELKARVGSGVLGAAFEDAERLERAAQLLHDRLGEAPQVSPEGGRLSVRASSAEAASALAALAEAGLAPAEFTMGAPSLEEVFFALTGAQVPGKTEETA